MIKETSISYYGLNYVEHAEADFREMVRGAETVAEKPLLRQP